MAIGIIGQSGVLVHALAAVEFLLKRVNVITLHQLTGAHFALARELAIKHAAMIHVLTISQASERSSVQRKIRNQLKDNSTHGYRI